MTEPALDDVIRQIAAHLRRGEHVDLQDYIQRYPSLADPLQALYPALTLVEDSAARVRGGHVLVGTIQVRARIARRDVS